MGRRTSRLRWFRRRGQNPRMRSSSRRLRIETALAVVSLVLFLLTLIWREWIELIFRVDPDGGNGAAEILIATAFAVAALVLGWRANRTRKRLRLTRHAAQP
jgi:hypothetical protein